MFGFGKKEPVLQGPPPVKTVAALVESFTGEFQKVANHQDKVVMRETQII